MYLIVLRLLIAVLTSGSAFAHDSSSYGGVFRSRNLGGTWLRADVGLFLNAALAVAVDPHDSSHLLVGTDLGLLRSNNGGRSWSPEAPDRVSGPVFALSFLGDGEHAICATPGGVFRLEAGRWNAARAPEDAGPARVIATGASVERVYLLGRNRLFVSNDGGLSFVAAARPLPQGEMTALAVARSPQEVVLAVAGGQIMSSDDGGGSWNSRPLGDKREPVDSIVTDPLASNRIWAGQADRIHVSDDLGLSWRTVGRALPEAGTVIRGIAANVEATMIVVTTSRGLYRSEDGGETWRPNQDNLPVHLEAGPLARDPGDGAVLYAVYSLVPYSELWGKAAGSQNWLTRIDSVSVARILAVCLLIWVGGRLFLRWFAPAQRRT